MFLQVLAPCEPLGGPILIDSVRAGEMGARLAELSRLNAHELRLIGLIPSEDPEADHEAYATTFEGCHEHDSWFRPCPTLVATITEHGQDAISALLQQTHPGGLDAPVNIETLAGLLNVSVPTVRRMIKAEQIPFLKIGKRYRFVPRDVFASLAR